MASDSECRGPTRSGVGVLSPFFSGYYLFPGPTGAMQIFWESRDLRISYGSLCTPWGTGSGRLWCSSFMLRWAPFTWAVGSTRSSLLIGQPSWVLDLADTRFWLMTWSSRWPASSWASLSHWLRTREDILGLLHHHKSALSGCRIAFLRVWHLPTFIFGGSSRAFSVVTSLETTGRCYPASCYRPSEQSPTLGDTTEGLLLTAFSSHSWGALPNGISGVWRDASRFWRGGHMSTYQPCDRSTRVCQRQCILEHMLWLSVRTPRLSWYSQSLSLRL